MIRNKGWQDVRVKNDCGETEPINVELQIIKKLGEGGQASVYHVKVRSKTNSGSVDATESGTVEPSGTTSTSASQSAEPATTESSDVVAICTKKHVSEPTAQDFAMKILPEKAKEEDYMAFENEICHLKSRAEDDRVVRIEAILLDNEDRWIGFLMPLAKCSSHNLAKSSNLQPLEWVSLLHPIISFLAQLHASNSLHRDIKPDNILIFEGNDGSKVARLSDFGVATKMSGYKTNSAHGTPFFRESGISECQPHDEVYTVGMTLMFLFCGVGVGGRLNYLSESSECLDAFLWRLLANMTGVPKLRPKMTEIENELAFFLKPRLFVLKESYRGKLLLCYKDNTYVVQKTYTNKELALKEIGSYHFLMNHHDLHGTYPTLLSHNDASLEIEWLSHFDTLEERTQAFHEAYKEDQETRYKQAHTLLKKVLDVLVLFEKKGFMHGKIHHEHVFVAKPEGHKKGVRFINFADSKILASEEIDSISIKSDVYDFGRLAYYVFYGRVHRTDSDVVSKITNDSYLPEAIRDILCKSLNEKPEQRPSFADIKEAFDNPISVSSAAEETHEAKQQLNSDSKALSEPRESAMNHLPERVLPQKRKPRLFLGLVVLLLISVISTTGFLMATFQGGTTAPPNRPTQRHSAKTSPALPRPPTQSKQTREVPPQSKMPPRSPNQSHHKRKRIADPRTFEQIERSSILE